ncbi:hypothetical protein ABE85_25965 (plasmid) [Mitsuaria sp. 7]|nr:hypothetical protein ABE85_25965 [Mitsuaria sp. 7]
MSAGMASGEAGALALSLESQAGWLELWYEPWRRMHPGWLDDAAQGDPDHATAHWLARFCAPGPSLRIAYRWFCSRFGIDAEAPLPLDRLAALPAHLPLDGDALDRAALALGRVAHASHCLAGARRDLADLFSPQRGDAPMWRDALRQAKARPLRPEGSLPPSGSADIDLRRWALPLMGRLIEDALPGAWSRVRLRCDPRLFHAATIAPQLPDSAAALRRQAWRIWRTGAAGPAQPAPTP